MREALLLHGAAGRASEWRDTLPWLSARLRVVAADDPAPRDVTRAGHVAAAAALIRSPALVVGQSLGGHTAFLLAARRPELVGALVVAEASPVAAGAEEPERVRRVLAELRLPFLSGDDVERVVASLREPATMSYWEEWEAIRCPVLIVRGEHGMLTAERAAEMAARAVDATVAVIPGAGHDVHTDAPEAWRDAVLAFLDQLSGRIIRTSTGAKPARS